MAGRPALDELADLVVNAWLLRHGPQALREGLIDVLGVGAVTRLALNKAILRQVPGSVGLGGCWAVAPPPPVEPEPAPADATPALEDAVAAYLHRARRAGA